MSKARHEGAGARRGGPPKDAQYKLTRLAREVITELFEGPGGVEGDAIGEVVFGGVIDQDIE